MKIAIFLYGLTGGGATRRLVTLAEGLLAAGYQVELVVLEPKGPLLKKVKGLSLSLVSLKTGLLRFPLKRRLKLKLAKRALKRYFQQRSPDIFLSGANHAHLVSISAWVEAQRPCPLILRLSNHISGSLRRANFLKNLISGRKIKAIKKFYPLADFWVAVSKSILEDALHLMPYPRAKTKVIYNPLPLAEIREAAKQLPPHPWLREKRFPVILGAGRLSPQKDFETLLRAFAIVAAKRPARLVILGKGKQKKTLLKLTKKLGVLEQVSLPGFFENPWAFMARADVFVLSSRYEGLPGVLLEALALGCPVVSTDCEGGCAEILAYGKYGPLVPVGDYQALACAILRVLEASPPSDILKKRAEEFSVERAIKGYVEVFESLVYEAKS